MPNAANAEGAWTYKLWISLFHVNIMPLLYCTRINHVYYAALIFHFYLLLVRLRHCHLGGQRHNHCQRSPLRSQEHYDSAILHMHDRIVE